MVKLPGGFSPWQAVQQAADDLNPFDGGSRDRDIFSNLGNQRGDSATTAPDPIFYNDPIQTPQTLAATTGAYGGDGSNDSSAAADLAYLGDQESRLRQMLQSSGTALNQGLTNLQDSFNKEQSNANQQRSRAIEDFNLKREDTSRAKAGAIDKVDTYARTLADSVRRILGMASGSGSSAYQLAAPSAIARDASGKRTNVLETYGQNFRDLDTSEKRATTDFEKLLQDLEAQRRSKESDLRAGVLGNEQSILGSLAEVAAKRAQLMGGNYDAVRSATAPLTAEIDSRQSQIDNLFNQFRTPTYNVAPVNVQTPNLRDYTVDRTAINANNQAGSQDSYSPYAQLLKKRQSAV